MPMMSGTGSLRLLAADAVAPERLHAAFGAAFADYIAGPFALTLAQWPELLARQAVDLALSRVALRADEVQAFALVAPRPAQQRWRLATMGAVPAARGGGAAPQLLADLQLRAQAAGQVALELEVFAQNTRALRLYQRQGFTIRHALHGHERAPGPLPAAPADATPATVLGRADALAWLDAHAATLPELPLQVMPPVLAQATDWQAWQQGSALLVFSPMDPHTVLLRCLVDTDPAQADAQALVQALCAAHPQATLKVPPLQRPDVGGQALQRLGFETLALQQWWMLLPLASSSSSCPRCGQAFHCGVNDPTPCACSTIKLSAALQADLRQRYSGCLCGACLRALAAGAPA